MSQPPLSAPPAGGPPPPSVGSRSAWPPPPPSSGGQPDGRLSDTMERMLRPQGLFARPEPKSYDWNSQWTPGTATNSTGPTPVQGGPGGPPPPAGPPSGAPMPGAPQWGQPTPPPGGQYPPPPAYPNGAAPTTADRYGLGPGQYEPGPGQPPPAPYGAAGPYAQPTQAGYPPAPFGAAPFGPGPTGGQVPPGQYGVDQYGFDQFGATQAGQAPYPGGPYGPGSPYGAPGPYGQPGDEKRPLTIGKITLPRRPLLAVIGVGALVAIAAIALALSLGGNRTTPPSTAATGGGATPTATSSASGQSPTERKAATQLAGLLSQSGSEHAAVTDAVLGVESCGKNLGQDARTFSKSAANRHTLLAKLAALPGRSSLPAAMLSSLTGAWQASATVDTDLAKWATHAATAGCHGGDLKFPSYVASLTDDQTASTDKADFVVTWNRLARQDGLPTYQAAQL